MSFFRRYSSAIAAAFIAAASLPGAVHAQSDTLQTSSLTDDQRAVIRERLMSMLNAFAEHREEQNSTLTEIFMQAAATERSALEFYLDCIQEVDFRRAGKRETEFREWKSNNKRMDSDEFANALQIQLRYLAISVEAERSQDVASVFPQLLAYIDGISGMEEVPDRLLTGPVNQSIFARRYDLDESLWADANNDDDDGGRGRNRDEEKEKWERRPLNIGGMYEKTVLPYLHENSPEKVPAAWTKRIQQEANMATVRGDAAEERFGRFDLPNLQWDMYKDQFTIGQQVEGAAKMLEHIEKYKDTHPNVNAWIEDAVALIFPQTDSTYQKESSEEKAPTPGTSAFDGLKLDE